MCTIPGYNNTGGKFRSIFSLVILVQLTREKSKLSKNQKNKNKMFPDIGNVKIDTMVAHRKLIGFLLGLESYKMLTKDKFPFLPVC